MKTVWEIYNNIEKDFKKRLASSPEAVDAINELNDEELKRFRSRVFDHYLSLPENQLVLEEEINIPSKPIYGFGGAKVDTPAVYRPAKTRRVEFSEIEPFVLGQKPQGFWSRVGDDLSNVGKAWKAGNFYSEGGWNDIAQNIINGGTPEERETLYKNYLDWESKNQMPENKSWVGDVVNGVANLVPLTVDMLPEAATVGAATAAGGAALGSVVPGAGTVAGALGGLKLGVGSSMAEQSYKVGVADIYTSLRKDGVDDETAKNWAIWAGIPYGALEFMGKGVAPIQRKFLGGKVLKELIDKVSDEKIKNKILNAAAKYGADVALTGTLESAIEGGQGGITELARQGAKGEGYDVGKVASATWDEAAQAAPAMFGMAALGVPLEAATNFKTKRLQKDLENVQNAVGEGRKVIEVPAGVKNGEVFTGSDGKAYKNVDGVAQPYVVKINPEVPDTDNLDADAESDPYGKPAEKPTDKNAQPTEAEQAIYQQELQDELARLNAEYNKIVSNVNTDDSSTKTYSLAEKDYAKMTDAELVEAHRKAETAKDYSAGFEIKKEWDKRRGYNRDLYHGSPSRSGASVLQLRGQLRDQGGLDKEGTVLPFQHASGRRTVHNTYEGRVSSWGDFSQEENSGSIGIKGRLHSSRPNRVVPVGGSMNEVSKSPLVQFHGRDTNNNVFNGKEALTESNISQAGNGDFKYSIDEGDYFNKARNELPIDKDSKPNLLDVSGTDAELFQRAQKTFDSMPMFTRAADGVKIKLKVSEGGSMAARVVHMISNNSTGQIAPHKLAWLPNVQGTIENAQVRLKGRYDTRKQGRREPNRIYIRRYGDGTIHAVVVSPYGEIIGQDIKSANVITQYPVEKIGEIYNATVDWVNPKMTEASAETTEASHIKDLSHQGTVPLPEANGPTSKDSAIPDSRRLSMPEESETSRESQAKIDGIKAAVEGVRAKFNRRAKVKASVDIVGTLEEAREKLGADSIPYNARAVQDKERVVIIAENIADADEAVRIFLHELVGHWGVKKLFKTKADLKPFLNYIITHYQDSDAWKRVAKYYKDVAKNKYAIAEEVLAHVAENRELSDPSMWKRLVHRVKRELWGNGVPQEYVNLLNEDVLRSAIALSREWAKGDHYLNANGIWAKIDSTPKGRDVPDDEKQGRFSLKERPTDAEIAEAQRQKDEVKAKWTNPDGTMKKGYHCAPNGKPSKLTEEQWLLVRTPNFKKWFGDWETLAIINEVENMPASAIKLHESLDKAGIKEAFKSFGEVENERDGRVVVFPTKSAGKIHYHKGFNTGEVIRNFKSLFESAMPIISEKEILKEGHKVHGNVESYEHYINKFSANGNEYFIRFTVPVIRNNKGAGNVHSSAISEVSIYKNGDSTLTLIQTPGSSSPSFIDRKFADFLNSVKPENVSKVVDENGEPLVVYHGTESDFYEFKHGKAIGSGDKFGYLGEAFYATNDESVAETYGDRVIPIFLNLKNPYTVDDPAFTSPHSAGSFAKSLNVSTDKVSDLLKLQGYDGVIAKDEDMGYVEYAVYNSNQIKSATDNVGTFSENPDIRWSIREDSEAEIAEARRQKDEVKAKWINPDGSMKKGYMKAPNGKPTNLSEDQWLQVRTPNFKKWFGDWEKEAWAKAAMDFLEKTAPVANLTGHEFQKDGVRLTDKVSAYFNSLGNIAHNEELGDVILDLKGVEDSIAHGVGRLKSAAFMAVPKVIEKGFIFNRENNWKERGWDTAVIVAPVRLGEDDYICEVVAKKVRGKQRFYLHEVEIKKTLDGVFKSVANNGNASQVSRLIIGKHIAEVKGNVSKVVDENGEPMVVYHGTPKFDRFNIFKKGSGGYLGPAIYFTNLKAYAQKYENKWGEGGNLYDVFLSLRNPLVVKSINPAKEILKTIYGKDGIYDKRSQKQSDDTMILSSADIKKLQSKGYDGVIWEYGGSKEYAVYNSNQIKSATDNIGSFSTNNPDIRYSIKEDDERASNKKEWDNTTFSRQVDSYAKGNYPSGKFFTVGTPSALLKSFGIPDNKIVMAEGVLKKIKAHGLSDIQIKQIPEAINSPVGIFSYPKNENVFDVLVEMYMDDGRPIIVSLEINKTRQGLGEITDLLTAHPKENFGRIVNWAKKGRCKYWNKQKGRKLLQDTIPADWERYETELTPYLPLQSEVNGESQGKYSLKEETPENDKEYRQKRAREEIQSKAGRAVQAAVDAFAPLATLERVLYGDVRGAEKSAWKMALMTRNLDQVMFHVLRIGGIKYNKADGSFVKREGTKGLEEILKPVKGENYKNFEHYAKAKSAIERWGFLRKTNFFAGTDFYKTFGFSLEDAKKWVAEGSEASKKAFGELQVFFQGQRDFMLETGLISQEQHAALSRFKNYVPFFREGADLDAETEAAYERFSEIFPAGKGFSGRNSGVEKFEGSARRTKNLVENIVNQSRKVMDSGYKNIAAYRSLNLMRELDMAKYVRSDSVDAQVKIAEMRRALEAEGIEVGDISDEELLKKVPVEAYLKITDDSNDNIVSVRVNGTLRFYKVEDPELLVAVKNFGAEKVNVMWKLLTAPKNIMTQAITKTPEFAIRNFIRDTGSNTILFGGKTIAPYLAHTAKNAVKSAWNTADMQKVWAAGAGGGAWYSVKAEDIAADFKDGGKIQKIGKYTIKPLKWLLNEYERRILMPSEQGNRISVRQKALENGASDMEAAFQYLDVMNFGMRGSGVWTGKNEWAKGAFTALHAIIRITPFLNARIQGLYKLWRESGAQQAKFKAGEEFALKERTRAFIQSLSKAVLLRGMMLASASMLYSLYANSSTDDDGDKWFEKLPAHDKLNYWHIYLGNNNILRIPKPFEIGYIFGTIPEAITDALIQKRPQTAKVLWEGLTSQLEFDPLSNPVIDTAREQYWNKDSFTKRLIIQQSDKDLKPRYQYDPDTSATAKAVARVFEGVGLDDSWLASPARIQNVIGNFLGGMTKYITAASDVIVESLTDIEGGTSRYARESATKRVYDWAVRNTKTMSTRNAEDYYELRNRVREIYGAVRVLRQEKRLEECQNLIDEHKGELGNYNLIEAVNTRLGEISRKRKALGADRTLSTEELIRADDELLAERNRLLADVDILIDRVEKGDFNARDMRDILKRIRNADREKRDSKKARVRLRELANMR